VLPGAFAALLFLALALGSGALGPLARPLQLALALGLVASAAARPRARSLLRTLAAHSALSHYAALVGVTLLALFLRTWGLRFGLPYLEHPDEWAVADEAARMLQTGDYRPTKWDYPTLYMYLQVGVAAAHYLWGVGAGLYRDLGDLQPQHYYPWMRALTAALGTAAVPLTYLLGRTLYGRAVGLAGAALLAVMPVAVGDAHYVTTDTPAMFFTLAAFLMIARLGCGEATPQPEQKDLSGGAAPLPASPQERKVVLAGTRWPRSSPVAGRGELLFTALLAGLLTGLAAATKYNVAALVVALAAAIVFARRRPTAGEGPQSFGVGSWSLAASAALGILLGFTLGMPLWLAELRNVLEGLASIVVHYRIEGHPGAESSRPALFYWGALANEGLLVASAMLAGLLLAFVRRRRADLLVLAFVVPTVLQLTGVKVVFFRNLMPLLPFLCLLAAAALAALVSYRRTVVDDGPTTYQGRWPVVGGRWSVAGGRGVLMALAVALVAAEPLAQALHDEQLRARPTTRVLATEWVETNAPAGARVWLEDGTLLLSGDLRVEGGRPITSHPPEWYRERGFRYLVALMDRDDKDPALLAAFGEPAMRFERAGERHGPTLAVYDTGAGDVSREPRTPSGATLGSGALVLEGFRHPGEVRAGEVLPLALYWQAARPLPADYTVFVHLVDAQGAKAAQRDLPPLEGRVPTSRWAVGELIRDDQDLVVPAGVAPGSYRLLVGMYDAATLASITDGGPIDLGEITVTR
jgi:4-amino-4-deoxy-L-arabinose transferase-like glycosyltransferase